MNIKFVNSEMHLIVDRHLFNRYNLDDKSHVYMPLSVD